MSVGWQLMAVLARGDGQVSRVTEDMFTEEELPSWRFLHEYYTQFGGVPSPAAFQENDLELSEPTGSFEYHLERVVKRTIYNIVTRHHGSLVEAMNKRSMDDVVDIVTKMQVETGGVRTRTETRSMAEWAQRIREEYQLSQTRGVERVTLGWRPLDNITGGAFPGDIVAVVARPGVGKTYTLGHMAIQAWRSEKRVLFVSMEMTDLQMAQRMIGIMASVDPAYIKRGQVSTEVWQRVSDTLVTLEGTGSSFYLVGGNLRSGVPYMDSLIQELNPDIVYVDASYLLRSTAPRNKARWEVLAEVNEGMKESALRRGIPLVHSTQFGKQAKSHSRHEHDLGMIGGTDVVGQVASIVIGIRPGKTPDERTRRIYTVHKNREGPLGGFMTNFLFAPVNFNVIYGQTISEVQDANVAREQRERMSTLVETMRG